MDFRPILFVIGTLLCILATGMAIPMLVDMYAGHDDWRVFAVCIATTTFFGGTMVLTNAGGNTGFTLNVRQAFMLTTLSWLAMAAFGALPIWLSHESIDFTDAFFESMSGITTTGSTILTDLDSMPPGTLLWRSIMQWLGGIGVILMAILILPFLKVGGMQLFRTESSDKHDKAIPRLQRLGMATGIVYATLTGLCILLYSIAGMSSFDAFNHGMTTVATSGFSTHNESMGFFESPVIHWICTVFMILGALPFILYVKAMGGNLTAPFRSSQVRVFLTILLVTIAFLTLWVTNLRILPFWTALEHVSLNVVSIVSTTGYASADYTQWGSMPVAVFFIAMFIGGCTGSTSGGIKIMRIQVMWSILSRHIRRLIEPNVVAPLQYDGRTISDDVSTSVTVFIFTSLLCFAALSVALGFTGLDLVTSISGAASALMNVGPALGPIIGPAGNYSTLPDAAKWILSFGMLLGRLEMFTVLVLFSAHFWRR